MNFVAGRDYEGYVWVRADNPTTLFAALESRDGTRGYAETRLNVTEQRLAAPRLHAEAQRHRRQPAGSR